MTTEDSGTTVELRVGESFRIELERDYHQPRARHDGIVERTSARGGYPTGKKMVATFRAVAPGRAGIDSATDYECLYATPSCARPQQSWSVHVLVRR